MLPSFVKCLNTQYEIYDSSGLTLRSPASSGQSEPILGTAGAAPLARHTLSTPLEGAVSAPEGVGNALFGVKAPPPRLLRSARFFVAAPPRLSISDDAL